VLFVNERDVFWERYSVEERRTALFCFLYLLTSAQTSLVLQWWRQSDSSVIAGFFGLLCRVVLTMEYRGKQHVLSMTRDFTAMKMSRLKQQIYGAQPPTTTTTTIASTTESATPALSSGSSSTLAEATSVPSIAVPDSSNMRSWKKNSGLSPRNARPEEQPASPAPGEANLRSWRVKVAYFVCLFVWFDCKL
jgi:hypothetical protein